MIFICVLKFQVLTEMLSYIYTCTYGLNLEQLLKIRNLACKCMMLECNLKLVIIIVIVVVVIDVIVFVDVVIFGVVVT